MQKSLFAALSLALTTCSILVCFAACLSTLSAATVSWVGGSGDWNNVANWSSGALPGPGDDVVIDRPGVITVTHSVASPGVKSVLCQEQFVLSGGALTVSNTMQVNNGFMILGGTLMAATILPGTNGQAIIVSSGTLDGVTVNGDLDLMTVNGASATVLNGLVLNGTAYLGNPTNSSYGSLNFSGSQTLGGNGTVIFGNQQDGRFNVLRLVTGGTTLTLGPGITVRGKNGTIGYSPVYGGPVNVGVTNQGAILAEVSGGRITVQAQPFVNAGTMQATAGALVISGLSGPVGNAMVSGGGTLDLDGAYVNDQERVVIGSTLTLRGSWTNAATITLSNATFNFNGTWRNAGAINVTNSTINLGGSFTLGNLGTLNRSGGTVNLTGTLEVGGGALALNAATGSWVMNGGTLRDAVLSESGGAQLVFDSGTLDGVTVNGDLDLMTVNGASATVLNGLVLNGTAYLGNPTNSSYGSLNFSGSQTLGGNGTVIFGNQQDGRFNVLRLVTGGTTLTLGPGITVRGKNGTIGYSPVYGGPVNVGVTNQGAILAEVSGGRITVQAQPFVNAGTMQATAGALVISGLSGPVGNAMVSGGGTLDLDGAYVNDQERVVIGSTLTLRGSWTNAATITLSNATFNFNGTWRNAGAINVTNSTINLGGSFTLGNLGTLNRSGGTVNLTGTLEVGGGALALNAATGSWVMNGGTLRDAVLSESGGAQLVFDSGTLDGVTVNGDLDLMTVNGASATVLNGLVLNGTAYLGNPTNSSYGSLNFSGSQTLGGNGTVIFGNQQDGRFNVLRLVTGGTTLTLGPGITVRGKNGTIGYSPVYGGPVNVGVTNQGAILAEVSGGRITVQAQPFVNAGTMQATAGALVISGLSGPVGNAMVSGGGTLDLDGAYVNDQERVVIGSTLTLRGSWTNAATITLSNATFNFNGTWRNAGAINVTNSTINLGGSFTLGNLGTLNRSGGTVNLTGTLEVGGGALALNAATGSWVMNGGTLRDAVLSESGGAQLVFDSGTLDGVTVNGDLDLMTVNGASATVLNGLVLNGTAYLGNPTNSSYGSLNFSGSQTLGGNGTVIFGNQQDGRFNVLRLVTGGTTLTLGPGITVRGKNGTIGYSPVYGGPVNVGVTNQGAILAEVSGGRITVQAQPFVNAGTMQATAGALVISGLSGPVGNAMVSGGGTLDLDGAYVNDQERVVIGSTLTLRGSWTNAATITLSNATFNFNGTWRNAGAINVTNSTINLGGSFTLGNLGTLNRSGGTVNLTGTLEVGGGALALNAATGSWVMNGGTLRDAVLSESGGAQLVFDSGTLDGVTVNGDLDLMTVNGASATVLNGLVLNGTAYLGNPTNSSYGSLNFSGSQTLGGNGTVIFGNQQDGRFNVLRLVTGGTTLTLGPGITVRGKNGTIGYSPVYGGPVNVGVTNQGAILAEVSGGRITVQAQPFVNAGTMQATAGALVISGLSGPVGNAMVSGGGTLDLDGAYVNDQERVVIGSTLTLRGSWTNAATITLSNATFNFNGTWRNAGAINVTNSTINLGGSFTLGNLGTLNRSGGTVNLTGTLEVGGGALALNAATGSWVMNGGTLRDAVLSESGGAQLVFDSGTLDGVTVNGDLDLMTVNGASATVLNGLVLNGTAYLGNPTNSSYGSLNFSGSQTLGGNGTVIFGNQQDGRFNVLRLVTGGTTLTLGPGITVRGKNGTIGYSPVYGGPVNVGVTNQGAILAEVSEGTITINAQPAVNLGTMVASGGGRMLLPNTWTNLATVQILPNGIFDVSGSVTADDAGTLIVEPTGRLELTGNLLGGVQQANHFSPLGTLVFKGSGNAVAPQLVEVMSPNLGDVAAGFTGPFASDALLLANNTYVRLVDLSDNSPGAASEALYVNGLVVPAGCTLDLNGLSVYAHSTQINGTVVGGAVNVIPDSGTLTPGTPGIASLALPGELDEWRFSGLAGRSYLIVVDSDAVSFPPLEYVEVRLLNSAATVLERGTNSVARQPVSLTDVVLPSDDTYRIQVLAPSSQSAASGNYRITVWEITPNVAPLVLNQIVNGQITAAYSVDRWTFSAVAGQQVRFDLLSASTSGMAFTLRGPNGWVGYRSVLDDAGFIALPASGAYRFSALANNGASDVAYAFRLIGAAPPPTLVSVTPNCANNTVRVEFSQAMDPGPAQNVANYSIPGVLITSATLNADGRSVTLGTGTLVPNTSYTLTVNNVTGLAAGDVIVPNPSQIGFQCTTELTITLQPVGQTVAPGSTITFTVAASGSPPLRYAWYKDSFLIAGATNAMFSISNAQVADVGRYSVRVSSTGDTVTSLPAELAVLDTYALDLPAGYSLIANQLHQGNNLVSAVLPAVPNGTTLLKWNGAIQAFTVETYLAGSGWVPGTTTLAPGEGAFINLPSPQTLVFAGEFRPPTLPLNLSAGLNLVSRQIPRPGTFEEITGRSPVEGVIVDQYRPATGDYRTQVFVDGEWRDRVPAAQVGEAVWVSQFTRPIITGQPAPQTNVTPGSTVNFAVTVTGTPPLRYQWQRNGVSISDATNASYSINNAQILDSGIYTVAVQPGRITPPTPQPGVPEDLPGALISAPAALRFVTTDFPFSDAFGARPVVNTPAATLTGNNSAASLEPGEPSIAGKPGAHSVWLAWMAPANGIVTFFTLGSSFDTLLAAYTGNGFPGTEVVSDDDGGAFLSSRITFNATAGQIYNIAVDGFGGGAGNFVLSWNLEVTVEQVPAILTQPQNQLVSLNGSARFTVEVSGVNLTYQWFRDGQAVSGATSSNLIINPVQNSSVGVYIVQINSGSRFVLSQPAQLQIVSAGEDEPLALDKFQDVVAAATNNALAALRGKAARKVVAHGFSGTQIFSSVRSTKEADEPNHCGVRGGKSEWFSYQPTNHGTLKLDTDGSNFDTVLAVYVGPGDSFLTLTNVVCDNNSGTNGTTSSVLFNVTSNTIYYIAVDGVNNPGTGVASSGRIQLNYRLVLPIILTSSNYSPSNNNGRVIFKVSGTPNVPATVQAASSLSAPTWTSLFTNTSASGSFTYTNTNAMTFPNRFYRVINRF